MNATDIIKESLHYPFIDKKKWMIIGVLFVIINILNLIGLNYSAINGATGMVNFLLEIFIFGFGVSIVLANIKGEQSVPDFNLRENIIDGIKLFILYFVYEIIPFIVTVIAVFATGLFTSLLDAYNCMLQAAGGSVTSLTSNFAYYTGAIPTNIMGNLISGIVLTVIISLIFIIISMFFANIGVGRMVETGSLKEGLNIKMILNKINLIGWGKYLSWFVLLIIVTLIIGFVSIFLSLIPFIGVILSGLILSSFILFFNFAAIGKIYNEA